MWRRQQSGGGSDLVPVLLGLSARQPGVRGGVGAVPPARDLPPRQREVPERRGVCHCVAGTDPGGGCLPLHPARPLPASLPIKLFVSVESQVVQLPTSSANLSALVSPPPGPDSQYNVTVLLVPRVNCLLVVTILPAV